MATQLQIRRGTSAQVAAFTGAEGEVVVNTTNDSIHVNDGSTAGGFEMARADLNNVSDTDLNAALTGNTVSALTVTALTTGSVTTTGNISFGDNDKAIFGAGSDLQIYHDGSNSYISDQGNGTLKIQGDSQVRLESTAGERYFVGTNNGAARLYYDDTEKLATTSTGIDVTGVITTDGMTTSADVSFGDNDKAIFGAGSDLQIYHDGSHSYVSDQGTGDLRIIAADFRVRNAADNETMIQANADSDVSLWYNNSKKLATTNTGIDVTGTATVSATTPSIVLSETDRTDENTQLLNASGDFRIRTRSDDGGTNTDRFRIDHATGDISFYNSAGTSQSLFWDSSAESLGIGTTSPSEKLHVNGTALMFGARMSSNNGSTYWDVKRDISTGHFHIADDSLGNVLTIRQDTGNVGIGTSSPSEKLEIRNDVDASTDLDPTAIKLYNNSDGGSAIEFSNGVAGKSKISFGVTSTGAGTDDSYLGFSTGANAGLSEAMRIDSLGNVGIGGTTTTGWANKQLVLDAGADTSAAFVMVNNTTGRTGSDGSVITLSGSDMYLIQRESANMIFRTANTERMRIDSSGNLLVGTTTSPSSSDAKAVRYGVGVQGGSLSSTVALTAGVVGNVINLSSVTSGNVGAGMYLVTLVRHGGSYGTHFVGIYGVGSSSIVLYETLRFSGITISVSGTTIRANASTTDDYNCNVIPLSID